MFRVLVDTSAYSAMMGGDTDVPEILSQYESVLMSPIVMGELYDGFLGGARNEENRKILARFIAKPRTVCIPVTENTSDWFAEIKQGLRRKGRPIPINDVWIAASCMEHGARLLSFDDHFNHIDGLLRC
jgi:tRNA(fMet)-specific endonuclease VapC